MLAKKTIDSWKNILNGLVIVVTRMDLRLLSSSSTGARISVRPVSLRIRLARSKRILGANVSGINQSGIKETPATIVAIQKVILQPAGEGETKPPRMGPTTGPTLVLAQKIAIPDAHC